MSDIDIIDFLKKEAARNQRLAQTADTKSRRRTLSYRAKNQQRAIAEIERLRHIIGKWYEYWPEPWAEGMDGSEMQEFGAQHGILDRVEAITPCSEWCNCVEYYGGGEEAICYRLKEEFRIAADDPDLKGDKSDDRV